MQISTEIDVCNLALLHIGGQDQITAIGPPDLSPASQALNLLYAEKRDATLRAAPWNFARMQVPLTLLKAAPNTPENANGQLQTPFAAWSYEYLYPPDCVRARYLVPLIPGAPVNPPVMTNLNGPPAYIPVGPVGIKFVVAYDPSVNFAGVFGTGSSGGGFGSGTGGGVLGTGMQSGPLRVILTNLSQAQLVYTIRITDPTFWDQLFLDAFSHVLGAFLVNPLNRNRALLQDNIKIASDIINSARLTDGDEGIHNQDHQPDWISIRGAMGHGFYDGGPGWGYLGYDGLVFPGGYLI